MLPIKNKTSSENCYLPQYFSILFHLLLLKTGSRDKNGLSKMKEATVGLYSLCGNISSGRDIVL